MIAIGIQEVISLIKNKFNRSPPNFGSIICKEWNMSNSKSLKTSISA